MEENPAQINRQNLHKLPHRTQTLNPTIHDEVIYSNILPRLPAKLIGRFRCVSKSWRSVLSSPKFIRSHVQINGQDEQEQVLMATDSDDGNGFRMITITRDGEKTLGGARTMSYPNDSGRRIFQLGPSCHGLVLLTLRGRYPPGKFCNILLNPLTRDAVEFPRIFDRTRDDEQLGFGLGYDSVSDDYKVVSISDDDSAAVNVYSLKTKTWRKGPNIPYGFSYENNFEADDNDVNYSCHRHHGVFLNRHIYWRRTYYDYNKRRNIFVLVAFDLVSEEFEVVPLPSSMNMNEDHELPFEICVLDGFLALVFRKLNALYIWVMKEYGVQDSWTNIGKIVIPTWDSINIGHKLRVVCRLHEDKDEIVLECDNENFWTYNLSKKWMRWLDVDDLPDSYQYELIPFRGSLVSPTSWG